jgi:hypothetical protein
VPRRRPLAVVLTAFAILAPLAVVAGAVTAGAEQPIVHTSQGTNQGTGPHAGHGAAPATGGGSNPPATFVRDGGGSFNTTCRFSHARPDDPIVNPGQFGASHQHLFFGSRVTDADTTYAEARRGGTTCDEKGDTAGYWIPDLRVHGRAVAPSKIRPYYDGQAAKGVKLHAFPADLRIVAGDRNATSPQNQNTIKWICRPISNQAEADDTRIPGEPACPASAYLSLGIRFPDCWDGRNLDWPDHKRHMAYSSAQRRCPASHPVKLPRLRLSITWKTSGGTTAVTLSSGSRFGMHGDFWNTWDQSVLERKVAGLRK